jgi:hypothetical protein
MTLYLLTAQFLLTTARAISNFHQLLLDSVPQKRLTTIRHAVNGTHRHYRGLEVCCLWKPQLARALSGVTMLATSASPIVFAMVANHAL